MNLGRIHHEFKNSLQTVSSLLRIFVADVSDIEGRRVLKRMEGCVHAISTMYDNVQSVEEGETVISLTPYLNKVISTSLRMSETVDGVVRSDGTSDSCFVASRIACQIGLLFNEIAHQCALGCLNPSEVEEVSVRLSSAQDLIEVMIGFENGRFVTDRQPSVAESKILKALAAQVDASIVWPWHEGSTGALVVLPAHSI